MQTFEPVLVPLRRWSVIAAAYFAVAATTIRIASEGQMLATIWAADAVLLAILLARPRLSLRFVLSAGLVGNMAANVVMRGFEPGVLLYGGANMLAVGVAATILRRRLGEGSLLASPASVGDFILVAGLLAPILSAIPGAAIAWSLGAHPFGGAFAIWALADALGMTVFTPLLVAVLRGEFVRAYRGSARRERIELAALMMLVLGATVLVFCGGRPFMPFMLFAPVTLVTFRGGRLALKAAVAIVAAVGVIATLHGIGPFARMTPSTIEQALLTQAFLATLLLCSLPAAAVLEAQRATLRNLAERQALLERRDAELSVLAATDDLTGLLNRGAFRARVEEVLGEVGATACLLAIDLDRFKLVNDRFGHAAGDAALVHLARLLERHLRPADIVARLGGDEFMVLLPNIDLGQAKAIVERLHAALRSAPLPLSDQVLLPLAMSVGIAVRTIGASLDTLALEADAALYRAKFAGRRAA